MEYTVKQHEGRWIASDGIAQAEADSPDEALLGLLEPEVAKGGQLADAANVVAGGCVNLIRMLAIHAPAEVIRGQVRMIDRATERYLALPNN